MDKRGNEEDEAKGMKIEEGEIEGRRGDKVRTKGHDKRALFIFLV